LDQTFGTSLLALLLVAAVVAMLTTRLHLPYSVGLVVAGMALALLPVTPKISLTKDLLFAALLPPLLFEAALNLRWPHLRRELPLVLTLATAGVLVSGAATAAGMHYGARWDWSEALVFGALIAATDPVSVIAIFREARAHGRLPLLIESESLFNDGTAAVAFTVVLAVVQGHGLSGPGIVWAFFSSAGGGLLCGAAVSAAALFLTGRTRDHLVELTFTMVAAYGSFLLAESIHCSGVLASITAGLIMGNLGSLGVMSDRGREYVSSFWEFAAFVANSLIFLLIGMREAGQSFAPLWVTVLAAIVFVMLGRAAAVYPLCALFRPTPLRVTARYQHVLVWGGLRGALALALALGVPADVEWREEILKASLAVVAFSIFMQGLTVRPLLRRIGEVPEKRRPGD
jgi:CPA1 family monovalent cation:H+ antiporter